MLVTFLKRCYFIVSVRIVWRNRIHCLTLWRHINRGHFVVGVWRHWMFRPSLFRHCLWNSGIMTWHFWRHVNWSSIVFSVRRDRFTLLSLGRVIMTGTDWWSLRNGTLTLVVITLQRLSTCAKVVRVQSCEPYTHCTKLYYKHDPKSPQSVGAITQKKTLIRWRIHVSGNSFWHEVFAYQTLSAVPIEAGRVVPDSWQMYACCNKVDHGTLNTLTCSSS